ncbi:hypothetical protein AALC25_17245 [Lachnospiraceae bacterium 29-84]
MRVYISGAMDDCRANTCHGQERRGKGMATGYLMADQKHPFMGLDNKTCKNPRYWCRLHRIWLLEEDTGRKKCRCRWDFDMIGMHRCGNLEEKRGNGLAAARL